MVRIIQAMSRAGCEDSGCDNDTSLFPVEAPAEPSPPLRSVRGPGLQQKKGMFVDSMTPETHQLTECHRYSPS